MKRPAILVVALSATLFSLSAYAGSPVGRSGLAARPSTQAGLAWRCGKNNPASWGTFGNGCLKQKRNWGKRSTATKASELTTAPANR